MQHLTIVVGLLLAVFGCSNTKTNVAGGGAHAYGSGSIAVGGPAGRGTQVVNISGLNHATPDEKEAIVAAYQLVFDAFSEYHYRHDPPHAARLEMLYKRVRAINTYGTPKGYRDAHAKFVQAVIGFRSFCATTPDYNSHDSESVEARQRELDKLTDPLHSLSSVAKDYGVDLLSRTGIFVPRSL